MRGETLTKHTIQHLDIIYRREIDVWQTKNTVFLDDTEMEELHSKVQHKFNKFLAGLPPRRMAEHRINLTLGQINNNYQIIEDAPGESWIQCRAS